MGTMVTKQTKEQIHAEIVSMLGVVPDWVSRMPDAVLAGFWTAFRDLELAETRIPNKYKELIGLGVSGATRCRYCALFHTEAARLYGATDEEIAEASMMAGMTMMASTWLNAQQMDYEKFKRETLGIVSFARKQMQQGMKSGQSGTSARV